MRAGFAAVEITPPTGIGKIGWIKEITIEEILDPLFARVAVLESGEDRIALVQLDTLSIRWTTTNLIRERAQAQSGIPGANIMVAATHNHAGPAVANCGDARREDAYVESMVAKVVEALGEAVDRLEEAEVGFNHVFEFGLTHNRRTVMRDGRTVTHGAAFSDPGALYVEGPIDPEVGVLAARRPGGQLIGTVVNFTCHPVHHGGGTAVSAGFPGALASAIEARGCLSSVFLNGASGNISPGNPVHGIGPSMEELGEKLADDAMKAIEGIEFKTDLPVCADSTTIQLPYRDPTPEDLNGTARGAQRFVDPAAYDRSIPALLERIKERGTQPAEVQTLGVGEVRFVSIPAEYFVEHGLRIKEETHPRHTLVVGHANGMVGYVPTAQAFKRGGYETTFGFGYRMAPEAGDLLADAAIDLVNGT